MPFSRFQPGGCKCCRHESCFITSDSCLVAFGGGAGPGEITGAVATFTNIATGAVFTSSASDGQLTAIVIGAAGSGYDPTNPPTITIGTPGSGAAATPVFLGGAINGGGVTANGGGYTAPSVAVSGGPGTGASVAAIGGVDGITLGSGGTGYTDGSYTNGTFTGGGGASATFSYVVAGGVVTSVTLTSGGNNLYASAPTPVFNAGPGTGATATATIKVNSLVLLAAGRLYISPTLTITDAVGTGSGATATATAATITMGNPIVTNRGSGYSPTSPPAIGFTGGSGSGATATARVHRVLCVVAENGVYDVEVVLAGYVSLSISGLTLPSGIPSANVFYLLPTGTYTINWTVSHAGPGPTAIAGATVTVSNANHSDTCTSDAAGHCTTNLVADVNSGYSSTVAATATGYVPFSFTSTTTGGLDVCDARSASITMTHI